VRSRSHRRDRGSATVLAVGVVAVLLMLTASGLLLLSAVVASHRARAAADLAALAGAAALVRGPPGTTACGSAWQVARANGGHLAQCHVLGEALEVTVEVTPWPDRLGRATAVARAGPSS
jgi:secretion/DNA translocation related TadE-like protein